MRSDEGFYTEATTGYWQEITEVVPPRFSVVPPYRFGYPVRLSSGSYLVLPLRLLPDGTQALASLIANHAANTVVETLAEHMADQTRLLEVDLVVGLPTLGLAFASMVAMKMGHTRYAPLGYSRKFWYTDELSEPATSITSPDPGKLLRLDPNLLPLLEGRRVALIDDAISSGATAAAAIRLLRRLDVEIAGVVVAMKQTKRWQEQLSVLPVVPPVRGVYGCPVFRRGDGGWWPIAETQPEVP